MISGRNRFFSSGFYNGNTVFSVDSNMYIALLVAESTYFRNNIPGKIPFCRKAGVRPVKSETTAVRDCSPVKPEAGETVSGKPRFRVLCNRSGFPASVLRFLA